MFFSSKAIALISAICKDEPPSTVVPAPRRDATNKKSILFQSSSYGSSKRRPRRNKNISIRPDLCQIKWIEARQEASTESCENKRSLFHSVMNRISLKRHPPIVPVLPADSPLPTPEDFKKKLLVLDLDETLIHTVSTYEQLSRAPDNVFYFDAAQQRPYPVYKRPGVEKFLMSVASQFEVAVWTAGTREYAEPILNWLDPYGFITTRLYRDSCTELEDGSYVKDLSKLNRSLSEVVIVDNNPYSFQFQPDNGIQCLDFYFDKCDTELKRIRQFLHIIKDVHDIRTVVPQFQEWTATGHLNHLDHADYCFEDALVDIVPDMSEDQDDSAEFLVQDCDYDSMVADSADAAVTVEDDAQKEMLGSFFYIDEKGRQRRRSHRLSKVLLVSSPN
jgi:carboxy-terminal domain RNA polymerase II polypeptide A small phosphatase